MAQAIFRLSGFPRERVIGMAGVMMLEYLGWREPGTLLREAVKKTVAQKTVTYDLARQMEGATEVKTSKFADAIIAHM